MELKDKIIERLLVGDASGEQLGIKFGVSRAAVNKCVKKLREEGYDIEAAAGRGYRLNNTDVLSAARVRKYLNTEWEVQTLSETTSTNDVAKKAAALGKRDFAVIAERQSAGRGRLGRSFASPSGKGLYMSAVVRPCLTLSDCGKITAFVAVAAAKAVENLCGKRVEIKWVNDLYMDGKKICGILTEGCMGLEGGSLEYAAVGIGINVAKNSFPPELAKIATDVETSSGKRIDRCELAAAVLDGLKNLERGIKSGEFLNEYKSRSCIVGKEVIVNGDYAATALCIDDDCSLWLEKDGKKIKFSAGEVSLKIK